MKNVLASGQATVVTHGRTYGSISRRSSR
jgi:hypothetical protein